MKRFIDTVYDWLKMIAVVIGIALAAIALGYSVYIEMSTKIAIRDAIERRDMPAGVIVNNGRR